jgi:hypothetical protein
MLIYGISSDRETKIVDAFSMKNDKIELGPLHQRLLDGGTSHNEFRQLFILFIS